MHRCNNNNVVRNTSFRRFSPAQVITTQPAELAPRYDKQQNYAKEPDSSCVRRNILHDSYKKNSLETLIKINKMTRNCDSFQYRFRNIVTIRAGSIVLLYLWWRTEKFLFFFSNGISPVFKRRTLARFSRYLKYRACFDDGSAWGQVD